MIDNLEIFRKAGRKFLKENRKDVINEYFSFFQTVIRIGKVQFLSIYFFFSFDISVGLDLEIKKLSYPELSRVKL
jgi:hypothetical protein